MHKGLYWSQLVTGVGIGLILASSVWIYTEHITIADALAIPQVGTEQKSTTNTPDVNPTSVSDTLPTAGEPNGTGGLPDLQGEAVPGPSDSTVPGVTDIQPVSTGSNQGELSTEGFEQGAGTGNLTQQQTEPQSSVSEEVSKPTVPENLSLGQTRSSAFPIVYAFVVDPGDSSERIASKLEAYGLASSNDFLQIIHAQNLDRKLKAGHYELTAGESLNEIIAKLTR